MDSACVMVDVMRSSKPATPSARTPRPSKSIYHTAIDVCPRSLGATYWKKLFSVVNAVASSVAGSSYQ